MTFEQLQKANAGLKTVDVKGKNYVEVNQRIKAFRMCYPEGTIQTEIIALENGVVTMKATVSNSGNILGTGLAQEKETGSFINKTSFIENCETSAVGRALGMCGFGIDTSLASAEEVENAINNQSEKYKDTSFQKASDELPFSEIERYCCEKCKTEFVPLHAKGKNWTAKELFEESKKANGKALCKKCIDEARTGADEAVPDFLK